MNKTIFIGFVTSVIGLAAFAQDELHVPKGRELKDWVARSKASTAERLRDPDSAKFRNLYLSDGMLVFEDDTPNKRMVFLCGEVNAKNAMGGYAGFQRFVATPASGSFEVGSPPYPGGNGRTLFSYWWDERCAKKIADVH